MSSDSSSTSPLIEKQVTPRNLSKGLPGRTADPKRSTAGAHRPRVTIVNPLGAQFYEDLSPEFLDECIELGIGVVGCTADLTWDDTLEAMENLQSVKRVIEGHPNAYVLRSRAELESIPVGRVGVLLGLQNPKPFSDSTNFLEAFIDMGLRCSTLALRENTYYGCGFASANDSGLSPMGSRAVKLMNKRGVVLDLSHSGDKTAADALALSDHPAIFSHSLSRAIISEKPTADFAGLAGGAALRAAPDELIVAAAEKGGVFCPDVRLAGSIEAFLKHVEHAVRLVGADHVGVCAQDDWKRSARDARRMQPYRPGFGSESGKDSSAFPTDHRIHRMQDQLGPSALAATQVEAQLRTRYSNADTAKIMGGNMLRVLRAVLQ